MSRILKIYLVAAVTVGAGAPTLTFAQSDSAKSTETSATDSKASDANSEFEKTRQHMIEKNRESQRTGQM